jgi:hypothetical protein
MSWFNNTNMDIIETAYSKYGEKRCRLKYTRTAYNRAAKTYPIPKPTKSVVVEFLKWKSDHFRKKKPGRRITERLRYRNKRMRHISIPANTPIINIHVTHSSIRDTLYDRSFFCFIAIHCRHKLPKADLSYYDRIKRHGRLYFRLPLCKDLSITPSQRKTMQLTHNKLLYIQLNAIPSFRN